MQKLKFIILHFSVLTFLTNCWAWQGLALCSDGKCNPAEESLLIPTALIGIINQQNDQGSNTNSNPVTTETDTTTPTVTITAPTNPYLSTQTGAVNLQDLTWKSDRKGTYSIFKGEDCNKGTVLETGEIEANTDKSLTIHAKSLDIGTNTLYVCVKDSKSGLTGNDHTTLTRDDTAPSITANPDSQTTNTSFTVLLTCKDTVADCEKMIYTLVDEEPKIDESNGTKYQTGDTIEIAESKNLKVIARDNAGNISDVKTFNYVIDTDVPSVTIYSVSPSIIAENTDFQINWQSSKSGNYIVGKGSACSEISAINGTNTSGTISQGTALTTTINSSNLSSGDNSLLVCVTDSAGNTGKQTKTISKDDAAPTVGNSGSITSYNINADNITLGWTRANDNHTEQSLLQYKVVYSTINNISTVADAEENRTEVQGWTPNLSAIFIGSLIPGTTYFFNILVKDELENISNYIVLMKTVGYSISGKIRGLTNSGFILLIIGYEQLTIGSWWGSFKFSKRFSSGVNYSIIALTQSDGKNCTVNNGSGVINNNVTNIEVICRCTGNSLTYDWGSFYDCRDGTVQFIGTSSDYSGKILEWRKCSQGQEWDSVNNTCKEKGTLSDNYGAEKFYYCSAENSSCNDAYSLNGMGDSSAFSTCFNIGYRVPSNLELKALIYCHDKIIPNIYGCKYSWNYTAPAIHNLFPNTVIGRYWSSSAKVYDKRMAFGTDFEDGSEYYANKNAFYYIRCVRSR